MNILWTQDLTSQIYKDALKIRYEVFVDEQKVPADLEIDDLENSSSHGVLYDDNQAIATIRLHQIDKKSGQIQRVAVLKKYRKKDYGKALMIEAEKKAKEMQINQIKLDSQNKAIPFYQKLAYRISSDEFMDAGIPHHRMIKNI
ncbi:MAG: GNAT family N-acetyltransferase [Atopostipes sp.]|nr:GNAT family N-acetyltransferase [Atopostipes sp.]